MEAGPHMEADVEEGSAHSCPWPAALLSSLQTTLPGAHKRCQVATSTSWPGRLWMVRPSPGMAACDKELSPAVRDSTCICSSLRARPRAQGHCPSLSSVQRRGSAKAACSTLGWDSFAQFQLQSRTLFMAQLSVLSAPRSLPSHAGAGPPHSIQFTPNQFYWGHFFLYFLPLNPPGFRQLMPPHSYR